MASGYNRKKELAMLKGWAKRHVKEVVGMSMTDLVTIDAAMKSKIAIFSEDDIERIVVGTFEKIANNCRYAIHEVTGRDYFAESIDADGRFPEIQPGNKKGTRQ